MTHPFYCLLCFFWGNFFLFQETIQCIQIFMLAVFNGLRNVIRKFFGNSHFSEILHRPTFRNLQYCVLFIGLSLSNLKIFVSFQKSLLWGRCNRPAMVLYSFKSTFAIYFWLEVLRNMLLIMQQLLPQRLLLKFLNLCLIFSFLYLFSNLFQKYALGHRRLRFDSGHYVKPELQNMIFFVFVSNLFVLSLVLLDEVEVHFIFDSFFLQQNRSIPPSLFFQLGILFLLLYIYIILFFHSNCAFFQQQIGFLSQLLGLMPFLRELLQSLHFFHLHIGFFLCLLLLVALIHLIHDIEYSFPDFAFPLFLQALDPGNFLLIFFSEEAALLPSFQKFISFLFLQTGLLFLQGPKLSFHRLSLIFDFLQSRLIYPTLKGIWITDVFFMGSHFYLSFCYLYKDLVLYGGKLFYWKLI